jgi:hypothetical protein
MPKPAARDAYERADEIPRHELLCLNCPVPGACNDLDPRCLIQIERRRDPSLVVVNFGPVNNERARVRDARRKAARQGVSHGA